MEKITLKLEEILRLNAELNGLVNQQTGEKAFTGILSYKMPLTTKYWLMDLAKKTKVEVEACDALRGEIIKKYGEEKDGSFQIQRSIKDEEGNDIINPSFISFNNEYSELLMQEKQIEYKPLNINDLSNIESEDVYEILFKLIKTD
jgi:hypothetical protein